MYITIDSEYALKHEFEAWNRDYYSLDACAKILELEGDNELDVIAICGSYTEYDFDELCKDYGYILDKNQYIEEAIDFYGYDMEDMEDIEEEYKNDLLTAISHNLCIYELDNGHYLVIE